MIKAEKKFNDKYILILHYVFVASLVSEFYDFDRLNELFLLGLFLFILNNKIIQLRNKLRQLGDKEVDSFHYEKWSNLLYVILLSYIMFRYAVNAIQFYLSS